MCQSSMLNMVLFIYRGDHLQDGVVDYIIAILQALSNYPSGFRINGPGVALNLFIKAIITAQITCNYVGVKSLKCPLYMCRMYIAIYINYYT